MVFTLKDGQNGYNSQLSHRIYDLWIIILVRSILTLFGRMYSLHTDSTCSKFQHKSHTGTVQDISKYTLAETGQLTVCKTRWFSRSCEEYHQSGSGPPTPAIPTLTESTREDIKKRLIILCHDTLAAWPREESRAVEKRAEIGSI